MALQHKSKLHTCRELKLELGFEEYLEYVRRAPSRLFLGFIWVLVGCLRIWGHANRDGLQECPNCRACKESVENVLFECACDS